VGEEANGNKFLALGHWQHGKFWKQR